MENDIAHIVNTFTSLGTMSSLTDLEALVDDEINYMVNLIEN